MNAARATAHDGANASAAGRASRAAVSAAAVPAPVPYGCACGGSCPRCAAGGVSMVNRSAAVPRITALPGPRVIQRVALPLDYTALAKQLFDAMDIVGTDEEAVYRALQPLNRDPDSIRMLEWAYWKNHQRNLRADIDSEFSDTELEYALQLLGGGTAGAEQRIESGPNAVMGIAAAIERLRAAVETFWGTDEEAIYATLLPFNRNTTELETAYEKRYGEKLRARLVDEMSEDKDELAYALDLLSPPGEQRKLEDWVGAAVLNRYFTGPDLDMARKILRDLLEVRDTHLDFSSEQEVVDEIRKRLRVSQLMQESQTTGAFGYPEALPKECSGYHESVFEKNMNARVNKAASAYWSGPYMDPDLIYFFSLTDSGRANAYDAVVKLFTPQASVCDQTLIHCDFLITVIQWRAYAETTGPAAFNDLVKTGKLDPVLTYHGFVKPPEDWRKAPRAWSLQEMRPGSENDLVIGDHVIFFNHLAYDAITLMNPGAWRLENALLVDKSAAGVDLYEGHGAPVVDGTIAPGPKGLILRDLMNEYNKTAQNALDWAAAAATDPASAAKFAELYPQVKKNADGEWIIHEIPRNKARKTQSYRLRTLSGINDPELIGLRDPDDPSRMNTVKRPGESAPGATPKP